ncbi:rRNA maturation RNase YbeY [Natranaerobius trueperi]|uniref:Endoribonuclease YbeY n=1 Tax=Natranaerobius trueperi TaxID=759412 RepID=A0A226BVP8_9FIRM|nr:rRNA maturation RNase YbeY [Natranaerobius trueperi]OWZ83063.1 rRNA maturation RNase YbeY [Natranaerobius trueperi]
MELIVNNQTDTPITNQQTKLLKKILKTTLDREELNISSEISGEVSLEIVDDNGIKKLNHIYRKKNESTDVLSFPQLEDELEEENSDKYLMLGDIVINRYAIINQAEQYGHSEERELSFLFLHGLLHLLGFDHDNAKNCNEMFALQEEILSKLDITRS